jgi:PII-like signaling protein
MDSPQKTLLILIDETDQVRGQSLYDVIVRTLERHKIAGATVLRGVMGYGIHRHIHRQGLLGVSDERPIAIIAIDAEDRLRAVLPTIAPMVKEGLIALLETEVVSVGHRGAPKSTVE